MPIHEYKVIGEAVEELLNYLKQNRFKILSMETRDVFPGIYHTKYDLEKEYTIKAVYAG